MDITTGDERRHQRTEVTGATADDELALDHHVEEVLRALSNFADVGHRAAGRQRGLPLTDLARSAWHPEVRLEDHLNFLAWAHQCAG